MADGDPISVLIVDDHAVVRRGLLAFLETEPDLEVVGAAAGGAEALAQLDTLAAAGALPDVVLMDLRMEPLDGIETTRRIRARYADGRGRRADVVRRDARVSRPRSRRARPATCSRTPTPTR